MNCVFAGTFDPITTGHISIIDKCEKMFNKTFVVVAHNEQKNELFSIKERIALIKEIYKEKENVIVSSCSGAIADFVRKENAVYVRGLRNSKDYEYETEMFFVNKSIYSEFLQVYIPCEQDKIHISSSSVKTLIKLNKPYKQYLPKETLRMFEQFMKNKYESDTDD